MKTVLSLVIACAFVVLVTGENCHTNSQCHHITSCDSETHVGCSHGFCTCLLPDAPKCGNTKCTEKSQCEHCDCEGGHPDHHCYDNKCTCGRLAPVGK